ncbi:hypothetical protein D3C72_1206070 [compost metagenome]
MLAALVKAGKHHHQHRCHSQDHRHTIGGVGRRACNQGQTTQGRQAAGYRSANLTAGTKARGASLGRELAAEERALRRKHHRRKDAGTDGDGQVDHHWLASVEQGQERISEQHREHPAQHQHSLTAPLVAQPAEERYGDNRHQAGDGHRQRRDMGFNPFVLGQVGQREGLENVAQSVVANGDKEHHCQPLEVVFEQQLER